MPPRARALPHAKSAVRVASTTLSMVFPMRSSRAMLSTHLMKVSTTQGSADRVMTNRTKRPAGPYSPVFTATMPTMEKMKAPMKLESAVCETLSATTSEKARGVALLLAEA